MGQSLGGGLAGLAAAAIGSTATLIAPAPFSNSLYTAAWSETLRRANISPPSNLNPNTIRDFIVARYDAATYEELDSVAEGVYSAYKNFILSDNVEVYRNKGEFLTSSTTGTIIDSSSNQFKPATDTFDLGDGNGLSLHSPTLSALEIRSIEAKGRNQDFGKLLINSAVLRDIFIGDGSGVAGGKNNGRTDLADTPSKVGVSEGDVGILERALWKSIGSGTPLYNDFYKLFDQTINAGAAADGKSEKKLGTILLTPDLPD